MDDIMDANQRRQTDYRDGNATVGALNPCSQGFVSTCRVTGAFTMTYSEEEGTL